MPNERLCRIKGTAEVVALSIGLAGAALTSFGVETQDESIVIQTEPAEVPCPRIAERIDLAPCDRETVSLRGGIGHTTDGPETDLGRVRARCEFAGLDVCDVDNAISRETAMCMAELIALGNGNAYRATLVVDKDLGVLVWDVIDGPDQGTNELVVVDAMSGEVLYSSRGSLAPLRLP